MNDAQTTQSKFGEKARPWASTAVLVSVAALGWGVAQGVGSFFDSIRVELSNNAQCCESFRSYRAEDSAQRQFWVNVIQELLAANTTQNHELAHLNARTSVLEAKADAVSPGRTGLSDAALAELQDRLDRLKKLNEIQGDDSDLQPLRPESP